MLRHFSHQPSLELIKDTLVQFDIPGSFEKQVTIIEFQILSPDSFRWRLLINGVVYYLYAEDYVHSFKEVQDKINSWFTPDTKIDFIKTQYQTNFTNTTPFKSAAAYKEPEDYKRMKQYAASSGYDFVFLCKSSEDPSAALFNGS